jgi:hypothetical protein
MNCRLRAGVAARWSVKDVPERFVKDVMELDTFSAALRSLKNVGFSLGVKGPDEYTNFAIALVVVFNRSLFLLSIWIFWQFRRFWQFPPDVPISYQRSSA